MAIVLPLLRLQKFSTFRFRRRRISLLQSENYAILILMKESLRFGKTNQVAMKFFILASCLGLTLILAPVITVPMKWASWCYFLMCAGLVMRKHSQLWHARLMASAIFGDLALVLILQAQRGAVQTAISFKLSALQQAHIGFSTLATVLYFPLLYLGWKQIRGEADAKAKKLHQRLGMYAFAFRTMGFFLMFSLLKHFSHG
jgi:hypothetical protein